MQRGIDSTTANEDVDTSREAIAAYLAPFSPLFLKYIQIRADEKKGLDHLFDGSGSGGRLVLATSHQDAKVQDTEETKQLVVKLKDILSNHILQAFLREKITKWQPGLKPESVNAIYIDFQLRFFGPVMASLEWSTFVENNSGSFSVVIQKEIQAAFCLWIVFPFLDKLGDTEENVLLKEKTQLLVKVINSLDNYPALIEVQMNHLRSRLNQEFDRIKREFGEGKQDKKILVKTLNEYLKKNFDKILLENWLPKEVKEKIAIETIDAFMASLHQDKKLEKHKKEIYEELFKHLKSFLTTPETPRRFTNPTDPIPSRDGLLSDISTGRSRSRSTPDPRAAAIAAEFAAKIASKKK